ncbi:MAG: aminotransferase class III-fold pyridoxal phosphate-dependent enzyme, partial [Bacteroidota bacterium]
PQSRFGEKLHLADAKVLEEAFQRDHTNMAAFILEPIVQGAGGMRMYSAAFLKELRRVCDHYDVLLICDEVATGFGRTGELFAVNHAQIVPDIMCLGKALTGGTMTMAATICTTTVAEVVCDGEAGVFMHGPTFMANPLACSAAIASLELLEQRDWKEEVGSIERILARELKPLVAEKNVVDVRVLGAIGVVECIGDVNVQDIQAFFVEHGVWIRPFRNLIYLMPPFIIKEHELVKLCSVIAQSIQNDAYFRA